MQIELGHKKVRMMDLDTLDEPLKTIQKLKRAAHE